MRASEDRSNCYGHSMVQLFEQVARPALHPFIQRFLAVEFPSVTMAVPDGTRARWPLVR